MADDRRVLVTMHLPLEMGCVAAIMKAVARAYPEAVVGDGGTIWSRRVKYIGDPPDDASESLDASTPEELGHTMVEKEAGYPECERCGLGKRAIVGNQLRCPVDPSNLGGTDS